MMKDVPNGDNINGDKQEAMYRVKSEATKDKNFTSKVQAYYNDIEVIGKVDPFTSTKDTQPPKVKATKPERFEIKLSENIGKTSTNKASSKITNPNIVMMSLSDSIEEKKPHTLIRPKSKQVADTSSVMIDTEEHVESPASKARYSLIKQAVPHL